MERKLDLSIDIEKNTLQLDENPPIKLKKSKGLLILDFLNKHLDKPFSPSVLRLNIENNQDVQFLQQNDEYSYLINQACQYIPATDRQTIKEVIKEYKKNLIKLDEAKQDNDDSKVAYFIEQNEMLQDYLNKFLNINHTIKNINQTKINDYKSVTRAIDNLIKQVALVSEETAKLIIKKLVVNSGKVCLLSDDKFSS